MAIPAIVLAGSVCCSGGGASGAAVPVAPGVPVAQPSVLTTMSVSIAPPTIQAGQTATAIAAGFDQKGAPMNIGDPAWTSSEPGVAGVSASGVVAALAPGQATVIARIGDVQGQATLVVTPLPPGPVPVATVTVSPLVASVSAGQTLQLTATPKDAAGRSLDGRAVTWTTSASDVATVSAAGFVTALAAGSAIIEVTCEGERGAMALTVTVAVDTEIVVTIAVPSGQLTIGDTMLVVATARSPYPITHVVASVGGKEMMLAYGPIGNGNGEGWTGRMDLSSLRFGSYVVVVTATDSRGHRNASSVTIVRDPRVAGGGTKPPTSNKQRRPAAPAAIP